MRVEYTINQNSFVPGIQHPWAGVDLADLGGAYAYNVSPNGRTLIIVAPPEDPNASKADTRLNVLVNFFDEVKRRLK
jgi:hypothetical protein